MSRQLKGVEIAEENELEGEKEVKNFLASNKTGNFRH